VDIKWNISDGKINVDLSLPEGYTYECLPADLEVASINEK
jgi:hypothetical protein